LSIDAGLSAMIAHVDVQIPFPIGTVWDLLTDLPRMASLSPEVESARWLTEEGCVQGARFLARNRRGPLQWQVTGEVTAARPPVRFSWVVGHPSHPSSTWTYELQADHGSTRVSQRFQHGPGMSWIRRMIGSNPAAATILIEQRRQMLESDMRVTLQRASSLLGDAAFPVRLAGPIRLAEDAGPDPIRSLRGAAGEELEQGRPHN
jgi:uncharacterized protein YndB with AHSA1/START domain